MKYISTRNKNVRISSAEAIIKGISLDGGLFVPEEIPALAIEELEELAEKSYAERVAYILHKYLDDFSMEDLLEYCETAYDKFDGDPCPLLCLDDGLYILELFHGPTYAFKDMALSVLPYLMAAAKKKLGIEGDTLILVATSGDTGKAALEGFKDVEGTRVLVFYPNDGVSEMQKLQMTTTEGENIGAAAIIGNFDDAQNTVKSLFLNEVFNNELKKHGYSLSAANSINWGRLAPQIAYYVSAYLDMVNGNDIEMGDEINFCVPSGNFGNILAGYYAKKMGLPINKLVCASNRNNILTDFLTTGEYDIGNRPFYKTMSPSMDILISSNLERLLFLLSDNDDALIREYMAELKEDGYYSITPRMFAGAEEDFAADTASEKETLETITNFYESYDYILDPHTGVAMAVADAYMNNMDSGHPMVVVATASPYKFPSDVYKALMKTNIADPFLAAKKLYSLSFLEIPEGIKNLKNMEIRHPDVIDKAEAFEYVLNLVKTI